MGFGLSEDKGVDDEGVEVVTKEVEVVAWVTECEEELLVEVLLAMVVKEPLLLVKLLEEVCGELGLVDKNEEELVVLVVLDVNLKYYINESLIRKFLWRTWISNGGSPSFSFFCSTCSEG